MKSPRVKPLLRRRLPGGVKVRSHAGCKGSYRPEFADLAIQILSRGACFEELSRSFGVSVNTIREWSERHPEFTNALKLGSDFSHSWWLSQGRKNLNNRKFNSNLYMMTMTNRFAWKRRVEETVRGRVEHAHAHLLLGGGPSMDLSSLSVSELETLRELRAKAIPKALPEPEPVTERKLIEEVSSESRDA